MRRVILGLGVTLDGYIARPGGEVDFLEMDPDYDWTAFFVRVDTWLLGRKTLDHVLATQGGKFQPPGMRTLIFSRTLEPGERDGYTVVAEDPVAVVRELRSQPGKDIWLGGGGELVQAFLEADLIDRLELVVVPLLLGGGVPLFPAGFPVRQFRLVGSKPYPKTGLLAVTYERMRPQ